MHLQILILVLALPFLFSTALSQSASLTACSGDATLSSLISAGESWITAELGITSVVQDPSQLLTPFLQSLASDAASLRSNSEWLVAESILLPSFTSFYASVQNSINAATASDALGLVPGLTAKVIASTGEVMDETSFIPGACPAMTPGTAITDTASTDTLIPVTVDSGMLISNAMSPSKMSSDTTISGTVSSSEANSATTNMSTNNQDTTFSPTSSFNTADSRRSTGTSMTGTSIRSSGPAPVLTVGYPGIIGMGVLGAALIP